MKILKTKINFKDARGEIRDILNGKKIDSITLITCKKGAVRGNHYHKKTFQYTYILSGSFDAYSKKLPKGKVLKKKVKAGDLTVHEPSNCHAFKALEDSSLISFNYGPRQGKDYEKDTIRLEDKMIK